MKIGDSESLLIAAIAAESFMPPKYWIATEIPTATYSCGATILPFLQIGDLNLHGEESFRNQ